MNRKPDESLALQVLERLPEGLLALPASALYERLGRPTLIHLRGRREPPLFVSILMHGNETVGWEAVRNLLARHAGGVELPRSLSIFFGNLPAAAHGVRRLPDQPDYNRIWPGSELAETPEHGLMRAVVAEVARRGVFASVDIHNNTGLNPHYACVNVLDPRFLQLAVLFGRTVVYFLRPTGVASMALARLGPAVTLECGKVGQSLGAEHAGDYLDACLRLSEIPNHAVPSHDIDLFHTVAQVKVPDAVSFSFEAQGADLLFAPDLDRLNFRELPRGTALASVRCDGCLPLDVRDERGEEVGRRFFVIEDGELRTRLPLMPSMLTRDAAVVRQDCLCYLMERYDSRLP